MCMHFNLMLHEEIFIATCQGTNVALPAATHSTPFKFSHRIFFLTRFWVALCMGFFPVRGIPIGPSFIEFIYVIFF